MMETSSGVHPEPTATVQGIYLSPPSTVNSEATANTHTELGTDDYESVQPVDQNVTCVNAADSDAEEDNDGFTLNGTSVIYEFTPGGYENLNRDGNPNSQPQQEDRHVITTGNSTIYDTGYEPSAAAPGSDEGTPAGYQVLRNVPWTNTDARQYEAEPRARVNKSRSNI